MNVLIMTLGKGRKAEGHRYQSTRYRFDDGLEYEESFFGIALHKWLLAGGAKMDRVVVLGTTGSSWDALLERDDLASAPAEELYLELAEAVQQDATTPELLTELEPLLKTVFNAEVCCRQIPLADTSESQAEVLRIIADVAEFRSHIWMDLTHGLRHLPILELFSALHLEETKAAVVEGLFYGMFEKSAGGSTPAVALPFAQEMSQWSRAVHSVNAGNVSALIGLPGMAPFESSLKKLIHYEQLNQVATVRKLSRELAEQVEKALLPPAAELYRSKLVHAFMWAQDESYCFRQFKCARKAIENRDYLRGIILLNETLITHAVKDPSKVQDYKAREEAKNFCQDTAEAELLRDLRNSVAHGTRVNSKHAREIMQLIADPDAFDQRILKLVDYVSKEISRPR